MSRERRPRPRIDLVAPLVFPLCLVASPPAATAQEALPEEGLFELRAGVAAAVEVDGRLAEAVWREAEVIELPFETFPGSNTPAPVSTECRVAYDEEALYVGCEARDPDPGAIRAYLSDRDELDGQDAIVLGLSPFDDGRRAFLFGVNPLGVQRDAMYTEGTGEDASWDAIWASSGRVGPSGWVVEIGIPFRSLRFPAREGEQSWAFYVERVWPRGSEVRVQSFYEDEGQSCRLCQVNRLTGLEGIAPGRSVQLTPTLAASGGQDRPLGSGEWSSGSGMVDAGLDVAWGITSDTRLNLTLNPDFSQIEADAAQLEVNRRFALFFPERRPFFLEGADLFATPLRLAFTRSIVDPDVGGKVTGKVGGHAFGVLVARDAVTSLLLPGPYGSAATLVERPGATGLATYRRDLSHTASLGALATARTGEGYRNLVGSMDATFQPLPVVRVDAQLAVSGTDHPDDAAPLPDRGPGAFTGHAIHAQAVLDTRAWYVQAGFRRVGPGFRADAGFVPTADRTAVWAWTRRRWSRPSSSALSELRVAGGTWLDRTTDGRPITRGGWLSAGVVGPAQTTLSVTPNLFRERHAGSDYELLDVWLMASSRPNRWLGAELVVQAGDAVDYVNGRPARQLRLEPSVTLRPGRHLEARLGHAYQRLETRSSERVLEAHVARARLVYSFTPRAFVRALVQYRRTERNPTVHADPVAPKRESALSQLLFSYKVNPQTVVFLGYSDDRAGVTEPGEPRIGLRPTGRTLFFKVGWALRP